MLKYTDRLAALERQLTTERILASRARTHANRLVDAGWSPAAARTRAWAELRKKFAPQAGRDIRL